MMLIFLATIYFVRQASNAVPVNILDSSSSPELNPPTCQCPGPQRSLWDIIWSCLATTFACAWVTIHPNVPEPDEDWWWVAWRRLQAMFWALVAPELIFGWSVRQYAGAWFISEKYKSHKWTMVHGHFLHMGGFILYENGKPKQTLDYSEFQRQLDAGEIDFPPVTAAEILDKSKGDALSKMFALVQTIWFITQCISRRTLHLALTELEITTLALATLNAMMYFCWWDKPLNVLCPVPVHLKQPNSAEKSVDSPASTSKIPPPAGDESTSYEVEDAPITHGAHGSAQSFDPTSLLGGDTIAESKTTHLPTAGVEARRWVFSQWMRCLWATLSSFGSGFMRPFRSVGTAVVDAIWQSAMKHGWWRTTSRVLLEWPIIDPIVALLFGAEEGSKLPFRISIFGPSEPADVPDWVAVARIIAIAISGAGFGSIHLLGWSFDFPSKAEQLIWRSGSLTISCEPVLLSSFLIILMIFVIDDDVLKTLPIIATLVRWWRRSVTAFRRLRESRTFHAFATFMYNARQWWRRSYMKEVLDDNLIVERAMTMAEAAAWLGALGAALFYVVARVSLLILAIITLRKLPPFCV